MAEKSFDGGIVRKVLTKFKTELRQRLPVQTLVSSLQSESVISGEEYSLIISGSSIMHQSEKLVDFLLTKDGSAILKALEILKTRECGYEELVDKLYTAMDALHVEMETCTNPAVEIEPPAIQANEYPMKAGSGVSIQSSQLDQVQVVVKRKRPRSSTSSGDSACHSFEKRRMDEYLKMKMDLEIQDVLSIQSKHKPPLAIRLLYANALKRITKLLEPHLLAVKDAADTYLRLGLHEEEGSTGVKASDIKAVKSISDLLILMSVKESWDSTLFLQQAVDAIPAMASERDVAEAIMSHYTLHLSIYDTATLLKDDLAKRKSSESEDEGKAVVASNELIPLEITTSKSYHTFMYKDCHHLHVQLLSSIYGIPEKKIICHSAEESQSTTVTFIIPSQYMSTVMEHSAQLPTVWVLLEQRVIEVAIPGMFSFRPSVKCFLMLLTESKTFKTDLLRITENLSYQMHSLLDWDAKEPLSGHTLRHKTIQPWPKEEESVCDTADSGVTPAPEQSDDTIIPSEVNDEMQSSLSELEVEKEHKPSIKALEEQLVQALAAQEAAAQKLSQMSTRESHLEDKVKMLETTKEDLETELEKLKQVKTQEEADLSDILKFDDGSIPSEGTDEMQSSLRKLEETVKDLKRKVANLFMDNVSFKTKLTASREVEKEHKRNIQVLEERLVQALAAQEAAAQKLSQMSTRESHLEGKVKMLETAKADLETELEKLKQVKMQEEADLSDNKKSDDAITPSECTDEMQSSLSELEVEKEQKQSIKGLEEQVVQALAAQEAAAQKLSQMSTRNSHLEDKVKMLETSKADLETELEKLEQLKMQEEADLSNNKTFDDGSIPSEGTAEKSRLYELEEIVKDLERRIAGRFMDYVHLYGELNPIWAAVQKQRERVINLAEQLAQEANTRKLSLLSIWESSLKDTIKMLETRKAGLEMKFVKLIMKQIMPKEDFLDATECGDLDEMKLFLKPAVNARDKWGFTPVLQAAFEGHTKVVDFLVEQYDCPLTDVTNVGRNALHLAAAGGHVSTIRYLAPKMQSLLHSSDNYRCTMLHYAAEEGHAKVVQFVIDELKLDSNSRDKWGMTPVLRAARHGHSDILDVLVRCHGSSLTDVDNDGNNALHLAARMDHPDTIRYLLPILLDKRHDRNKYGQTCLDLALQRGHQEVVNVLNKVGGPASLPVSGTRRND